MNCQLALSILTIGLLASGCAGGSASSTSAVRPSQSANPGSPISGSTETVCIDTTSASAKVQELREQICEQTNAERFKQGLAPLQLDSGRSDVAQKHAEEMALNNYFSHTSPKTGSFTNRLMSAGISYSTAGENIARNTVIDSQVIMNQWMSSTGHRANILKAGYGRLGVGYASGRWVQVFTN